MDLRRPQRGTLRPRADVRLGGRVLWGQDGRLPAALRAGPGTRSTRRARDGGATAFSGSNCA